MIEAFESYLFDVMQMDIEDAVANLDMFYRIELCAI